MTPAPITVIITSSNRFHLLERTLDSFLALNTYPIHKYILNEDSGNIACVEKILHKYGHLLHLLYHPSREGLSAAWDNLLRNVDTPYIFNLEDDWEFFGNDQFMQQSLDILENYDSISQVWCRDPKDHSHPLKAFGPGSTFQRVLKGYQGHWGGFSFNPSLRRTADLRRMFPNGLRQFGDEALCSRHAEQYGYGYLAVSLVNPACRHIGYGHHTKDFKA
jgi:hypothetical protein